MGALDDWYESLNDAERETVKRGLLGRREPETRPTPTERMRRGFDAQPDPAEIRDERRNKGGTDDGE